MKRFLSVLLSFVIVCSCFVYFPQINVNAVTTSQQNIVGWADYYYDITWTSQKTVSGWKGNYTYYQGNSYRLPYGQPATKGKYIGYGISIDDFLSATQDSNNLFYTTKSYYSGYSSNSVYYATDCSAFVSLCWGIPRSTTSSIPNYGKNLGKISNSTVNNLQIGDCLNSTSSAHVVLVTDVTYNNGVVTSVEITEQTPPQLKRTTYSASSLVSYYSSRGYYIYRYNGTVPTPPNTPQEPEVKYWYEDLKLVNLGDNFSARIRNVALDVLITNFNGNIVIGKHYNYKISRQIWNFTRNSDGSYNIKSCLNDYFMELHNFDDFDGGNITCIPANGSTAQDWFIYLNPDGSYSIRPKCSNERVIDVTNGNPTDGNNLQLWSYTANDHQRFSIEKCGEVVNFGDDFAASIEHTEYWKPIYQNDTGNVELTTSSREKMSSILWHFERDEANGWYTITSYKNGKCLEVEDNSTEPGANVQCGDYVGTHGQHWFILKSLDSEGNEYYYIKSACSSNNLDLECNSEVDGTNIKMWTLNSSAAQKYTIYKIIGDTTYNITTENNDISICDITDIIINDTAFVTSYKFHIISPNGIESVIDNECNYIYKFTPEQTGRYIIYGEVESPVSKDIGSNTDRSVEIFVSDHNYTSKVTKPATCTTSGTKTYTCSRCSHSYTEAIPATGHSWKSATCTAKKTCSTCGATEGSALGHSYTSKVTKSATCTTSGTKTYTCSRCSNSYTETIPATGHSWKSATCTAKKTCSTCGATEGSALGHNYTSKVTKSATCTTSGTKTYNCSRCSHSYTEAIPATGHTVIIDKAVPPTATEYGLTEGKHCGVCGKVLVAQQKIEPTAILGDVDGDGKVTVVDATLIQKYLVQMANLTEEQLKCADADKDSKVSVMDATKIQKYLVNLATL